MNGILSFFFDQNLIVLEDDIIGSSIQTISETVLSFPLGQHNLFFDTVGLNSILDICCPFYVVVEESIFLDGCIFIGFIQRIKGDFVILTDNINRCLLVHLAWQNNPDRRLFWQVIVFSIGVIGIEVKVHRNLLTILVLIGLDLTANIGHKTGLVYLVELFLPAFSNWFSILFTKGCFFCTDGFFWNLGLLDGIPTICLGLFPCGCLVCLFWVILILISHDCILSLI